MNNRKATKRALLTSVMALVMCVVMLVGTTLAWFTDTATANINKIEAGNLDVALEMEDSTSTTGWTNAEGKTLEFKKAANASADEKVLWEPGATYQLPTLTIKNNGNLALKYKINVSGAKVAAGAPADSLKLLDVLEWTYEVNGVAYALDSEKHLTAKGTANDSDTLVIKATMDKNANNDYQGMAIEGIAITVYATQDTVEYDSNGNTYDKDAAYAVYPAGVTEKNFPANASYTNDQGQTKSDKPATVAYVDESGNTQYAADLNTAISAGASVVYCKEDAELVGSLTRGNSRTGELTSDLTIYANGADFQNTEISINATSLSTESVGKTKNFTLKVYDAKNIRIWGATPNDGVTQNIILENCTFEGKGINSNDDVASGGIFYLTGSTGIVNLTMNNCNVSGSNQGVYLGCNGDITVTNSAFEECAAGMKISHKAAGICNVTVKNTTFDKCGWNTEVTGKEWLKNDSSSIKCKTTGTMNLTLENVAITNVVGSNSIVTATGVTVNATNVTVDGNTWSN